MSIFCQESLKTALRLRFQISILTMSPDLISGYGSEVCKAIGFPTVAGELWVNFSYLKDLRQLALCTA